jgi:hypothetical protein
MSSTCAIYASGRTVALEPLNGCKQRAPLWDDDSLRIALRRDRHTTGSGSGGSTTIRARCTSHVLRGAAAGLRRGGGGVCPTHALPEPLVRWQKRSERLRAVRGLLLVCLLLGADEPLRRRHRRTYPHSYPQAAGPLARIMCYASIGIGI